VTTDPEGGVRPRGRLDSWVEPHLKWLYWAGAVALAPWIVYLYESQIQRALAHDITVMAAGLIILMFVSLVATGWLTRRGSPSAVSAATLAATATFISAWFRLLTRTGGRRAPTSLWVFQLVVAAILVCCVVVIVRELADPSGPAPNLRWAPVALGFAALALVPSLVVVLVLAPTVAVAHNLRLAWTGLDAFELLAMAWTGTALHRHSRAVMVPAAITGTLMACDAWINIVPSVGAVRTEAILLAFAEVPLATLSFWVAARATAHVFRYRTRAGSPGDHPQPGR